MRNNNRKHFCPCSTTFMVLLTAILITTVTVTTSAKPLYLIADINGNPTPLHVYDIAVDGTLTFQAEHNIPRYGTGAIGIAIDSDSQSLFITYEDSSNIQLINARKMTSLGVKSAEGAQNLSGIVFDDNKQRLYCVDRWTGILYAYDWDARTARLTEVSSSPFALATDTAFGIALDSVNELLYVANNSTYIRVYRTSDWSRERTISVSHNCVSIAIDNTRGLLYFGGKYSQSDDYYLTQYNLATGTEAAIQVEPDAGVFGIAVDSATGFVYISTGKNNTAGGDNLKVFDRALNQIDVIPIAGNPTGLAIPNKDIIGYNPLFLSKSIIGTALDAEGSISTGSTIVYNICFNNKNNNNNVNNVSIIDTLPDDVSFITADGDGIFGQYDSATHTYTWSAPSLPAGSSDVCLKLIAQVNQDTPPGTTITNSATIESNETGSTTASVNVTTKAISSNQLNLSKNITKGTVEQNVDGKIKNVVISDTLTYSICFNNKDNDHSVNNVSIVDTLPDNVSFVSADGDGVFGQYNPAAHTYTWTYESVASKASDVCLKLVVQVNQDTPPGTTITNYAIIESNETAKTIASIDVTTAGEVAGYNPLNLSKSIINGAVEQNVDGEIERVVTSDTLIYSICFNNKDNDRSVNNVSIVDTLPDEVSLVSADGDGIFGQYNPTTHTYEWTYPTVASKAADVCLKLVVQVNQNISPGTKITNYATIGSNETETTLASIDVTTAKETSGYNPLNLSKSIINCSAEQSSCSTDECVVAGDTLIYNICFDNKNNNYSVTNVSIIDTLPSEVSFITADGDGIFGQYNFITHKYIWSYPSLPLGFPGACLKLVVQVNQAVAPGTIITNSVTIDSVETGPASASVNVVTYGSPRQLIAHWTMDDNALNSNVTDSSGWNNNGTAQRYTASISTTGVINGALNFNGTTDYITVPDRDEWTFNGDFTISLWVKFYSLGSTWEFLVAQDEGPGEKEKWMFSYRAKEKKTAFHINGGRGYPIGGYTIKGNTWAAQTGVWYFLAVTRRGDTYSFYRQGVPDGATVKTVQIPNADAPLSIGRAEGNTKLNGVLDDTRIYNEALTDEEIAELYN